MAKKSEIVSISNSNEIKGTVVSKKGKPGYASGSFVKEAVVEYRVKRKSVAVTHHFSDGSNAAIILAQATNKPESLMTPIEKMEVVRSGISKKDLERLKKMAGLDYDKLAKALSVTRATLINKKREERFNAALSDRIVGLADIYSYGYQVFEDEVSFNQWMFRPNKALGGYAPYTLLDNQFGREEVKNTIGRIEFGVYS